MSVRQLGWWMFAALLWASPVHAQRLTIEVGGANFRPYPVAVPKAISVGGGGKATKSLLREITGVLQVGVDLVRSMELVPPKSYLAPEKESWAKPVFENWVNVGASGLIRCAIESSDGKNATVGFRFYDVTAQRELLYRSYSSSPDDVGTSVHRFLDELTELLTGEEGIFSSRLTYAKKTGNGKKAIFISDIDGRNERRLTDPQALSLLPAWGPKGQHILFTSYLKSNPDLWRISVAGGKLEWLSKKQGVNTGAAVSPDGKRIALTLSRDGNTEIYVMDWNGANLRRLTDSWGQDVSATWSPDNRRIAFVSSRSGRPHIYVMSADGSNPQRLTYQGTYNQEPDWSPRDDGQIAFTARDEFLKYDIFLVHPGTGAVTRLTQDDGNNEGPHHSPDGHHIVFTSTRLPHRGRKIYIMDVDGNNQRRIHKGGDYETPAWSERRGWK